MTRGKSMIPIAEQERLLQKRAKRELEKMGYKLFSSKDGGFQIRSALYGNVEAGENYELTVYDVGRFAGICGYSTRENITASIISADMARQRMIDRHSRVPSKIDPVTGLYTPEYAAALEKMGAE